MNFNIGGFLTGAGLVVLLKKNPELFSNLSSSLQDIMDMAVKSMSPDTDINNFSDQNNDSGADNFNEKQKDSSNQDSSLKQAETSLKT
ncbi:hypothetical protein GMMP1_360013 [Candidatus Magnetomoraceae bacterium gMMP-1]